MSASGALTLCAMTMRFPACNQAVVNVHAKHLGIWYMYKLMTVLSVRCLLLPVAKCKCIMLHHDIKLVPMAQLKSGLHRYVMKLFKSNTRNPILVDVSSFA